MQIINKLLYNKALKLATKAHKGQKRWNGDDYITHPIRVANCFTDYRLKIIAILHDVIEDTDMSLNELTEYFPEAITKVVMFLTNFKKCGESYAMYIDSIRYNEDAIKIKIADLKDNLRDLKKGQKRDKYELALFYLTDDRRENESILL